MTTAIRIEVLPARLGDCLLVECEREGGRPWRMLVDGGPPDTWPLLERRLAQIDGGSPDIDVAVVTHVDSDHIGGMIPFLQSEHAVRVSDYWFNGRPHLPGMERKRSITQGESVTTTLLGDDASGDEQDLPWNEAFGGGAIDTGAQAGFIEVPVEDGPRITVLSPTTERLTRLGKEWFKALEKARKERHERGLEREVLSPLGDLAALVDESGKDRSVPNGASIALLVEHRGASVVLGADAFGDVLGDGLQGLAEARGQDSLAVDAFKLPHHGSRGNVFEAMLAAAPARHYLVSSNGDTFHHPDDAALARVVLAPRADEEPPTIWFNYRTPRTERWADPDLCARYAYDTRFPEDPEAGAVVELPARTDEGDR